MTVNSDRFWESTPLAEMSHAQWEALCDGCAKCCLHRLEDRDTREIHFTNVCCRYLDQEQCRCSDYPNRSRNVPDCVTVTPQILQDPYWLPTSCSYRLLAERHPLPDWHPLLTGEASSVVESGNSVAGRVVSELDADDLQQHMIDWIR